MCKENQANEFYKLFKRHLNSKKQAQLRVVKCTDVDWENKTMTAVDNEGLELFNVSLGLGSVYVKPQQDSLCIVGLLEGQDTIAFLINAENVELIEHNGGENGGLTITPKLVEELNKNNQVLQAIVDVINMDAPITEPGNGSASALQATLKTAITGKSLGDFSEIEDTKITH